MQWELGDANHTMRTMNIRASRIASVMALRFGCEHYERWFEDGRLEETGASQGGKASGQRRVFFKSGVLELEEIYVAGELEGLQRRFHENGRLEREGSCVERGVP
jgi:hypothetical protein